jgi:hypothetical protein
MKMYLRLCPAGAVALCIAASIAAAAEAPVIGRWEGERNGLKAVTITVRAGKGDLEGEAIFWVERDGRIVGKDERRLVDPRWDGKTLRFSAGPTGLQRDATAVRFEMTMTGQNTALLKRLKTDGVEELTLRLSRTE